MTMTAQELQTFYVAYFGRPGDPAGSDFWLTHANFFDNSFDSRNFVSNFFSSSPEYLGMTKNMPSNEMQIDQVYMNLFGRHADPEGLAYWSSVAKSSSLGHAIADLIVSAAPVDKAVQDAKTKAAETITNTIANINASNPYKINASGSEATSVLKGYLSSVHDESSLALATTSANINSTLAAIDVAQKNQNISVELTEIVNGFSLGTKTGAGAVLNLGAGVALHAPVSSINVPGFAKDDFSYSIDNHGLLTFSGNLANAFSPSLKAGFINLILGSDFNTAVVFTDKNQSGDNYSFVYSNLKAGDKFIELVGVNASGINSTSTQDIANLIQIAPVTTTPTPPVIIDTSVVTPTSPTVTDSSSGGGHGGGGGVVIVGGVVGGVTPMWY